MSAPRIGPNMDPCAHTDRAAPGVRIAWELAPRPLASILDLETTPERARLACKLDMTTDALRVDAHLGENLAPVRLITRAPAGATISRNDRWIRVHAPGMLDLSARFDTDGDLTPVYCMTPIMRTIGLGPGRYDTPRVTLDADALRETRNPDPVAGVPRA